MQLIYHNKCRLCHSTQLTEVVDLGEQYLQGLFVKPGLPQPPTRKIPLILIRCDPAKDENACGLLQLRHTVPPEILYSTYWYRSGTNQTMKKHLKEIAETSLAFFKKKKLRLLDVGCNDGTLLNFYPTTFLKVGIDPSNAVEDIKDGIKIIRDIFPSLKLEKFAGNKKFDLITSIAMFYDVDDPISFVKALKRLLSPTGLWIFEVYYMPRLLETNTYDMVCHEHICYYNLSVIEHILNKTGMKLIKIERTSINGGSLCCYATQAENFDFSKSESDEEIKKLRQYEFDLALETNKPYSKFKKMIMNHRIELTKLLKQLKKEGKKIHIYGASTKGNTILQFCGIDNKIIDYAADRNPQKHGAKTLGTEIPIISEQKSREMKPDYYLVLPWAFKEEFLKRERETVRSGSAMIFPFPEIQVISSTTL